MAIYLCYLCSGSSHLVVSDSPNSSALALNLHCYCDWDTAFSDGRIHNRGPYDLRPELAYGEGGCCTGLVRAVRVSQPTALQTLTHSQQAGLLHTFHARVCSVLPFFFSRSFFHCHKGIL